MDVPQSVNKSPDSNLSSPKMDLYATATSPWGLVRMAQGGIAGSLQAAPLLALKRLGPLCVSSTAQATLLAAYIGFTLFAGPLLQLAELHVETKLTSELWMRNVHVLMHAAQGRSVHLTDEKMAGAFAQQLGEGGASLARQAIAMTGLVPRCVVGLVLGVWQLTTAATLSPSLLAGAALLFAMPLMTQWYFAASRFDTAAAVAHERQGLQNLLVPAWQNAVIGLPQNKQAWRHRMNMQLRALTDAKQQQNEQRTILSLVERLPSQLIATLMSVGHLQRQSFDQPRLLVSDSSINGLSGLASVQASFWHVHFLVRIYTQFQQNRAIRQSLIDQFAMEVDLRQRIDSEKIKLSQNNKPVSQATFRDMLENPAGFKEPGLWTLQAPNGAGKTTFFALCKAQRGDDVFFLPAKHQLDFSLPPLSSGQTVVHIFQAIDAMPKKPSLLCLDEWDANLDSKNRAELQQCIDRWSQCITVIQAIHRNEDTKWIG
jgi:hypothetical protein